MAKKKTLRWAVLSLCLLFGACVPGSLMVRKPHEARAEETEGDSFVAQNVLQTVFHAEDDTFDVFVSFDKDIADAETDNLQALKEYKEKVYINGVPLETYAGCSMAFAKKKVTSKTGNTQAYSDFGVERMALKLHLDCEALDWTIAYGEAQKHLYANQIVIKQGFPAMRGGEAATGETLAADAYFYSGQKVQTYSAGNPSVAVRPDEFFLGFRDYYESAYEGWIMGAAFEDDAAENKYRLTLTLGTGVLFHKTFYMENVMRRDMNAVDFNYHRTRLKEGATLPFGIFDSENTPISQASVKLVESTETKSPFYRKTTSSSSFYTTAIGLRYSLGRLLTVNGMCISDWLDLPLDAAVAAGITENSELAGFVSSFRDEEKQTDYDGMGDVFIRGKQLILELPKSGTKTFGEGENAKSVSWQTPDMTGDIEVEFQSGFAGKQIRFTEPTKVTYEAEKGAWNYYEKDPVTFEEIKIKNVDAPVFTDAPDNNFTLGFVFDKKAASDELAYFTQPGAWVTGAANPTKDNYSAETVALYEKYEIMERTRTHILLGAVFADSEEFRTVSIADMMDALNADGTEKTDGQKANTATLHYAGGADARVTLGAHMNFYISDLEQNFTLTFKAGFRTPSGYEIKEDQNFIYDPVTAKWYKGTTTDDITRSQVRPLIDAIEKMPAADALVLSDELAIVQARNSYDMLSDDRKALITNYDKLVAAEARMEEVKKEQQNAKKGCAGNVTGGMAAFGCAALAAFGAAVAIKMRREEK